MSFFDIFKKKELPTNNLASSIFKEKKKTETCSNCLKENECRYFPLNDEPCDFILEECPEHDPKRKTLLIIDDNPGVLNFLKDDIKFLREDKDFDVNIVSICGRHAVFHLENVIDDYKFDYAIIDITFGGSKTDGEKTVKYTGVDAFELLYNHNKDLKFIFYTGNTLNTYINSNKKIIDEFYAIHGTDIKQHIIYKTSLGMKDRRKEIYRKLTKG